MLESAYESWSSLFWKSGKKIGAQALTNVFLKNIFLKKKFFFPLIFYWFFGVPVSVFCYAVVNEGMSLSSGEYLESLSKILSYFILARYA